jgi:RNA polymerase sigma-70 factor (sigma-E family)
MHTITDASFETLYREQLNSMVRLAYAILYDRGVAEDVVHEAFIKVARSWHRIDSPEPYLRRAVVNESISRIRRRGREGAYRPDPPSPVLPPELDETWRALERLPTRQRTALALRYYADLTVDQVAAAMNVPSGTVKSLIHRGLTSLKEVLEP